MGDTLRDALIPPHPVRSSPAIGTSTSKKILRSNLTAVDYKCKVQIMATTNFGVGFRREGAVSAIGLIPGLPTAHPPAEDAELSAIRVFQPQRGGMFVVRQPIGALVVIAFLTMAAVSSGGTNTTERATARAEHAFFEAQARYNKDGQDLEAAWRFALACFDWAEFAASNARRAEIAEQGITASRRALERDSHSGAAHYYLALNLGQLARTKKLGALKLVGEMETEFKTAIGLDPKVDYAGPDRSLGLLYLDAPGWPTSIGSRAKARLHLRTAAELCPDHPENLLCLLEAYLQWSDKSAVQSQLASTEDTLQRARKALNGEKWESSWQDWDRRWEKIKAKTAELSRNLGSPKQRK